MIRVGERTEFADSGKFYNEANKIMGEAARSFLVSMADIGERDWWGSAPRSLVMARAIREYLAERLSHANL